MEKQIINRIGTHLNPPELFTDEVSFLEERELTEMSGAVLQNEAEQFKEGS